MDDEYGLDVRTGLFGPAEDARWAQLRNGFRAAGVSISHPHIVHRVDWRQEIPVAGPVDVLARYRRERSLTARRDHPRIGVRWRDVMGSPWAVEAHLGVHFFKPSADVEVAVSRSWDDPGAGTWEVEAGVAALDAFNNTVFEGLGVRESDVEAHLRYRSSPFAARIAARRVSAPWLVEVHGGASTRSEIRVTFPSTDDPPFTQGERVTFAGALVQANPTGRLLIAAFGTLARADTERRPAATGAGGFVLREETATAAVRQRFLLTGREALEADLEWVWRPEERRPAGAAPIFHADREIFGRLALVRHPPSGAGGWTGRLAWALLDRDAGVLAPRLAARNQRLVTAAGYRFASGFDLTAGLGWDLDALGRAPFDGGHLRIAGTW